MENQNNGSNGLKNVGSKDSTKSIDKTLAILCTFNEKTPRQRTTDIATKLNMSISTVSRHLGTLLDWGFLGRDDVTGYYQPGSKIIALAGVSLQNNRVYRHALPELHELTRTLNVHGHMSVPQGTSIVHLISLGGENAQEWLLPLGYEQPMYCSAMGRAMLAYMPSAKAQEILRKSDLIKRTDETKIDMDEILNELKRGRKKGYFMIVNELNHGRASIGVPVFDQDAVPIAAISISASASRLSQPEEEARISAALRTAGTRISAMLGYYPR